MKFSGGKGGSWEDEWTDPKKNPKEKYSLTIKTQKDTSATSRDRETKGRNPKYAFSVKELKKEINAKRQKTQSSAKNAQRWGKGLVKVYENNGATRKGKDASQKRRGEKGKLASQTHKKPKGKIACKKDRKKKGTFAKKGPVFFNTPIHQDEQVERKLQLGYQLAPCEGAGLEGTSTL